MIDMEKLRPVIEPLLTEENTASVLESIAALDDKNFVSREDVQKEAERYHTERMKAIVWGKEKMDPTPAEDPEPAEEEHKPLTFEDLFKEG